MPERLALGSPVASPTPAAADVPAQASSAARSGLGASVASPTLPLPKPARMKLMAEKPSASHHPPANAAKRLSKLPCFRCLLRRMKRRHPLLDSSVPEPETISASPKSILKTSLKTSKARTDLLRSDVAEAEEDDGDAYDDEEEDDGEVFRDLHSPVASVLQRRRAAMDMRKLGDETEKDVDGEGLTELTAPVTPRRNKRSTIAQLRELNRAFKDIAPVPLTLRHTEAVMDLLVLDLETNTEKDR